MDRPTISIVGTGYVGLSSATILANAGFKVFTVDIDEKKIETIKSGKSYFYEVGLDEMIRKALDAGTLIPTTSYEESIPNSQIVFSCVGTPDREDGSPNLDYIYSAAESTIKNASGEFIYVQKSTVPVGTAGRLIEHMKSVRDDINFDYVSNPEFLREGAAVYDTLNMDRIVVGGNSEEVLEEVLKLYKAVDELTKKTDLEQIGEFATDNNPQAKKFTDKPFEKRTVKTSLESAELIKVSANAFLALKISFANEIAILCDKTGADINEVMDGVGMDHRIGRAFLYAGRGYGGGCFPKDVSGLISVAESHGVNTKIMKAGIERNDSMPGYILSKLEDQIGNLNNLKIAVLGLAFKTGTSDTRKSPGIKIANLAASYGSDVYVTDPQAMEEAKETLSKNVTMVETLEEAIKDADAVILATPWDEFLSIDPKVYFSSMQGEVFVDAVNAFDKDAVSDANMTYIGVGRGNVV